MPTDFTGQTFGSFKLIEQLGRGGMATVYRGYQESIDRNVAIKILPPEFLHDPNFADRFISEARMLAKLIHASILPLYDFGMANDVPYIVMPLMVNGTLADRLKQGPLSVAETLRIMKPIAAALDYAHRQGVIHRDIKPSNILFDHDDAPYLGDFGIAKALEATSGLTGTGIIGTPDYMSPEQAQGEKLDGRSDLYSLAVVIYQLLSGQQLFKATTPMSIVLKHITEAPPPIRGLRPDLPLAMDTVLCKALSKRPADRYQTATELVNALTAAADEINRYASVERGTLLKPDIRKPPTPGTPMPPVAARPLTPPTPTPPYKPPTQPPYTPPAYVLPPYAPAPQKKGLGWLGGIGIGMFITIVLVILLVVGGCVGIVWLASLAPTETPFPTQAVPTRTPTPKPQVLLEDDFSNPDSGWGAYAYDEVQAEYIAGEYRLKFSTPAWMAWQTTPNSYSPGYHLEVIAQNTAGDMEISFGLVCGYVDTDNFVYARITAKGEYSITQMKADKSTILSNKGKWGQSGEIDPEAGVYQLGLDCYEDAVTLYVEGVELETVAATVPRGEVGIIAATGDNAVGEAYFDDFRVTKLP